MNHNNSIILNSAKFYFPTEMKKTLFDQEAAWGEFDVSVISGSFTERNKTANKYVKLRVISPNPPDSTGTKSSRCYPAVITDSSDCLFNSNKRFDL